MHCLTSSLKTARVVRVFYRVQLLTLSKGGGVGSAALCQLGVPKLLHDVVQEFVFELGFDCRRKLLRLASAFAGVLRV